jgi:hypothetical protein
MFNVVYALGEMAMLYPISGGFYTYSVRFIDPSWGFAMGWNYVFQWVKLFDLLNNDCWLICCPGYRFTARTCCRWSHSSMVGRGPTSTRRRLDRRILPCSLHYQLVWCHGIRRRRILGIYPEAFDDCGLPVHGCDLRLRWWTGQRRVSGTRELLHGLVC